jgi:hypothetical protein
MRMRPTMCCAVLAASFALCGKAAPQSRVAVTVPTGNVNPLDNLDNPVTPGVQPPIGGVVPGGPAATPDPGLGGTRIAPPTAREPRGNPLWAVPLKSMSATRERPLFSPSRRPPAPPVAYVEPPRLASVAPPAEPERPRLSLIGLVVGDKDKIAIFVDETTREIIRLRPDQGHGGWVLRSVQGRETTLEKASMSVILALPAPGDAPGPTAPIAGPNGIKPIPGDQL